MTPSESWHNNSQPQRRIVGGGGVVRMEEVIKKLREAAQAAPVSTNSNQEAESQTPTDRQRQDEFSALKSLATATEGHDLPKFYRVVPVKNEVLRAKVNELAREMLLWNRSQSLFDHEELTELYVQLEDCASPGMLDPDSESGEKYISYKDYKTLVAGQNEKTQRLLTPRTFMKLLTDDPQGRVSINLLFSYIMRKIWLIQTRVSLSIYDDSGQGFLKEQGLESYITELIPTLVQLSGMDKSFIPFYVCTAVRKFFFFLDPNKSGRVKILDVLCSGLIDDLLDLRESTPPKPSNWFSFENTMKAYGQYLNLDTDHNGMLSPSELIKYSEMSMTLTPAFVDRLFQECLTFSGEMDYRTYLDLVLAIENPKEIQSIQYFFRILDIDNKGYLDSFTLFYFYKDILKCMAENGAEKIPFDDVKDEIFDMVKPKDPLRITFQDLLICGKGDTVVSILVDFQGFWSYETRESIAVDLKSKEQLPYAAQLGSDV